MANLIAQILIALNLLLGPGNHSAQATQNNHQNTNNGGGYTINGGGGTHCNGGIVIIDTDEL